MKKESSLDYATLLRDVGLRATPGRVHLLSILDEEVNPLTVYQLEKKLGNTLNQVTVYRSLQALCNAGIARRVNLEHDHAHYEMVAGREHHHHAICRNCEYIESIEVPHSKKPEQEALARTKSFSTISSYSLEFFGLCKPCSEKLS